MDVEPFPDQKATNRHNRHAEDEGKELPSLGNYNLGIGLLFFESDAVIDLFFENGKNSLRGIGQNLPILPKYFRMGEGAKEDLLIFHLHQSYRLVGARTITYGRCNVNLARLGRYYLALGLVDGAG